MRITKYKSTYWAIYDENEELICVTVYKKGALEVVRRLTQITTSNSHNK